MLDMEVLAQEIASIVDDAVAPLRDEIAALKAAKLPEPINGKDGRDGTDGKDADMDAVASLVDERVKAAVDALPAPEKGEAGVEGPAGPDGAKGADGANGKDGNGIADLLIDRDGALVATMDDGRVKSLGPVIGKDGQDGKAGADGADGLGFDDLTFDHDGERGFILRFMRGEQKKEFAFQVPVVIDRGVWKAETEYARGDVVTWGGSLWIAQEPTKAKPDSGEGWRLSVKRGRDGKDAGK